MRRFVELVAKSVWLATLGLALTPHVSLAGSNCKAANDQFHALSSATLKAQDKVNATPLYGKRGAMHSPARCAADRRVIAQFRKEMALMRAHPDCFTELNLSTTQTMLSNHEDDMKWCR